MTQAAPPSPPAEPARLTKLAIVVSRGTSNNLFQVATLVRAATALEAHVEVLFRDAALVKLDRQRINEPQWSPAYTSVEASLAERLRAADFTDMETFLRDAKQHGDAVAFWASSQTLRRENVALDQLIPLLDGERADEDFIAGARTADALLTF
jgi:peroxiredoxin family protein